MPSLKEVDAALDVAATESRWSINKLETVRRMLEAAELVRYEEMQQSMAGFTPADIDDMKKIR